MINYAKGIRLPGEVHEEVFAWVLKLIAGKGLVKGERAQSPLRAGKCALLGSYSTSGIRLPGIPATRPATGWPVSISQTQERVKLWILTISFSMPLTPWIL